MQLRDLMIPTTQQHTSNDALPVASKAAEALRRHEPLEDVMKEYGLQDSRRLLDSGTSISATCFDFGESAAARSRSVVAVRPRRRPGRDRPGSTSAGRRARRRHAKARIRAAALRRSQTRRRYRCAPSRAAGASPAARIPSSRPPGVRGRRSASAALLATGNASFRRVLLSRWNHQIAKLHDPVAHVFVLVLPVVVREAVGWLAGVRARPRRSCSSTPFTRAWRTSGS